MRFAWRVVKHVKSNAIVFANAVLMLLVMVVYCRPEGAKPWIFVSVAAALVMGVVAIVLSGTRGALPGFGLMLRALEMGTAGLKAPTGEAVDFPTNTSDALMSGGSDAIAGAVERMHRKLLLRTGEAPVLIMTGGAAVKLAPITDLRFETIDTLIFEGLLQLQAHRLTM